MSFVHVINDIEIGFTTIEAEVIPKILLVLKKQCNCLGKGRGIL